MIVWDPITFLNLILCIAIVVLGVHRVSEKGEYHCPVYWYRFRSLWYLPPRLPSEIQGYAGDHSDVGSLSRLLHRRCCPVEDLHGMRV